MEPEKRCIAIVRVSTKAQAKAGGIDAQKHAIRGIAKAHHLNIERWVEMADVSGADVLKAPEMLGLLEEVERGGIHGLIATVFSRIMRVVQPLKHSIIERRAASLIIQY